MKMEDASRSRKMVRTLATNHGVPPQKGESLWVRMGMPNVWGSQWEVQRFAKAFQRRFLK